MYLYRAITDKPPCIASCRGAQRSFGFPFNLSSIQTHSFMRFSVSDIWSSATTTYLFYTQTIPSLSLCRGVTRWGHHQITFHYSVYECDRGKNIFSFFEASFSGRVPRFDRWTLTEGEVNWLRCKQTIKREVSGARRPIRMILNDGNGRDQEISNGVKLLSLYLWWGFKVTQNIEDDTVMAKVQI